MPARGPLEKFLRKVLPAGAIFLGGVLAVFGIMVYRITHPALVPEAVRPSHYLLPYLDVSWADGDGAEVPGWWIPGLKGAPAILLAPGYGMSRSNVLGLAAMLREQGFNLLVYDQRGSGASPRGASSLGLHETDDMLAALEFLRARPEVNRDRVGVWGVDVGARAALKLAATRPEIRAVAADSVYVTIDDFMAMRVHEELGTANWFLKFGCREAFKLYMLTSGATLSEGIALEPLADRSILFIQGENRRELARQTALLYDRLQPQKEMISLAAARVRLMTGEELNNYDRQVSHFFALNLPRTPAQP